MCVICARVLLGNVRVMRSDVTDVQSSAPCHYLTRHPVPGGRAPPLPRPRTTPACSRQSASGISENLILIFCIFSLVSAEPIGVTN